MAWIAYRENFFTMNSNGRNIKWLDGALHTRNVNLLPREYLEPYAGLHVAFNFEGTEIVAHGDDEFAVDKMLREKGMDPEEVVFTRIPALDEDTWL